MGRAGGPGQGYRPMRPFTATPSFSVKSKSKPLPLRLARVTLERRHRRPHVHAPLPLGGEGETGAQHESQGAAPPRRPHRQLPLPRRPPRLTQSAPSLFHSLFLQFRPDYLHKPWNGRGMQEKVTIGRQRAAGQGPGSQLSHPLHRPHPRRKSPPSLHPPGCWQPVQLWTRAKRGSPVPLR